MQHILLSAMIGMFVGIVVTWYYYKKHHAPAQKTIPQTSRDNTVDKRLLDLSHRLAEANARLEQAEQADAKILELEKQLTKQQAKYLYLLSEQEKKFLALQTKAQREVMQVANKSVEALKRQTKIGEQKPETLFNPRYTMQNFRVRKGKTRTGMFRPKGVVTYISI